MLAESHPTSLPASSPYPHQTTREQNNASSTPTPLNRTPANTFAETMREDSSTSTKTPSLTHPLEHGPIYRADERPPLARSLLLGLQQVMVSVSVLVSVPFIIADEVCPGPKHLQQLRVQLISGTFVVCGISTIVQTMLGVRLALLQGVAFAYIPSIRAFMNLGDNHCNSGNSSSTAETNYVEKMAMIQGSLLASSCVTILIGATGLVGKITKGVGPITVTTLMVLLALSSVNVVVERMEKHWITLVALVVLLTCILYLARWELPVPGWGSGCTYRPHKMNILGEFPYLFTILFSWFICWLLTAGGLLPPGSAARTDKNTSIEAIHNAAWLHFPLPGEFGAPRFDVGLFAAFLVSVASTTLFEAVGNYHAVARISGERPPPSHAVNRGIMVEGLGCLISAVIGPGIGLTTHAENVAVIGITRIASRFAMVCGGVALILFGVVTKLGALLSAIPDPLVGLVLASSMGMISGVAIANLQRVDMRLTRNAAILGFGLMAGMCIPAFYTRNAEKVKVGWVAFDNIVGVLLTIPMFVGAFTACVLDNTVGGATRTQRGLPERGLAYDGDQLLLPSPVNGGGRRRDVYAYPPSVMEFIEQRLSWLQLFPFVPKQKKKLTNKVAAREISTDALHMSQNF